MKTTEEVCGTTMPHRWQPETWWWNELSQPSAKLSKCGRLANAHEHHIKLPSTSPDVWCTMHVTKQTRWSMTALTTSRLANQMRKENDVVGDKPVKNDAGHMSMSGEAKQNEWAEHYERLLNI